MRRGQGVRRPGGLGPRPLLCLRAGTPRVAGCTHNTAPAATDPQGQQRALQGVRGLPQPAPPLSRPGAGAYVAGGSALQSEFTFKYKVQILCVFVCFFNCFLVRESPTRPGTAPDASATHPCFLGWKKEKRREGTWSGRQSSRPRRPRLALQAGSPTGARQHGQSNGCALGRSCGEAGLKRNSKGRLDTSTRPPSRVGHTGEQVSAEKART